MTVFKFIINS